MKNLLDSLIGTKVSITTNPRDNPVVLLRGRLRSIPSKSNDTYVVANNRNYPDTNNYCIISVIFTFKLVDNIIEGSIPHIILKPNENPA